MGITALFDVNSDTFKDTKISSLYIEGVGNIYNLDKVTKITFNEKSKLWYVEFDSGRDRIYSTSTLAFRLVRE